MAFVIGSRDRAVAEKALAAAARRSVELECASGLADAEHLPELRRAERLCRDVLPRAAGTVATRYATTATRSRPP